MTNLQTLENNFWQVGILPETGASTAFGRVKQDGKWVDVMRPTPEADYDNSSNCASFLMIPWSNRVRDGRFRFNGKDYVLEVNAADGTAIHGDVRKRPWQVDSADGQRINLSFNSAAHENINFPFKFSARAQYWLEDRDFVMLLALKNEDSQPMPGGFGHHPYFVHTPDNPVSLELPFDRQFALVNSLPSGPSVPVSERVDFRQRRPLGDIVMDDQFTGRQGDKPARMIYTAKGIELALYSDPIFQHMVVYSPAGHPFYAVEPVTNANDCFNMYDQGVPGTGVFVLAPDEEKSGIARLRLEH